MDVTITCINKEGKFHSLFDGIFGENLLLHLSKCGNCLRPNSCWKYK